MSATVCQPQKEMVTELLRAGKWRNESEIVRYGLELVKRELEREALAPLPPAALREAYGAMSESERADERAMGRASAKPKPGDLD